MTESYVGYPGVPYFSQKDEFLVVEGSLNKSQIVAWKDSLCGLMCVGMIVNQFSLNSKHTIAELLDSARQLGAFDQQRGWVHKKIASLAEKYGINANAQKANDLDTIYNLLATGDLIIASVSPNYLNPELKKTADERSGHLVVITGMNRGETGNYQMFIHDPSSESTDGGQNIFVNSDVFKSSFSGNIISFEKPSESKHLGKDTTNL